MTVKERVAPLNLFPVDGLPGAIAPLEGAQSVWLFIEIVNQRWAALARTLSEHPSMRKHLTQYNQVFRRTENGLAIYCILCSTRPCKCPDRPERASQFAVALWQDPVIRQLFIKHKLRLME